jgi:small GTP-binding protein
MLGSAIYSSALRPWSYRRGYRKCWDVYFGRGRGACSSAIETESSELYINRLRNFAVLAHIDAGKSTLSDAFLRQTGAISAATLDANPQFLDSLSVERDRGITIKLRCARMRWRNHIINIVDTPGHCDFVAQVRQSLAAVEGVLLVVDATQGVQAQTVANLALAQDAGLTIVPVVNKIDLPTADPDGAIEQLMDVMQFDLSDVVMTSAKTGFGVSNALDAIVDRVPAPSGSTTSPLQALIFDSFYDSYRGIVVLIRVINGSIRKGDVIQPMRSGSSSRQSFIVDSLGFLAPHEMPCELLRAGDVGYFTAASTSLYLEDRICPYNSKCQTDQDRFLTVVILDGQHFRSSTNELLVKALGDAPVGDTITHAGAMAASEPLPGYQEPKPVVWCGLFPVNPAECTALRNALEKLQLTDASLVFDPDQSAAMGTGFRCGYLGLLHAATIQERLERDFGIELIASAPSVSYEISVDGQSDWTPISNPSKVPVMIKTRIRESYAAVDVLTNEEHVGALMELAQSRRGEIVDQAYIGQKRVRLSYTIPLAELVTDFYDAVKSRSRGYATIDYRVLDELRENPLARMDILIAGEPVEGLATVVHRDFAYKRAAALVLRLKECIPPQLFKISIQARLGGKFIASEHISPLRKGTVLGNP